MVLRVVVVLLWVGVTIYTLVDCLRSTDQEVRTLPRLVWVLVALAVPLVGGVAYLLWGRERSIVPAGRRTVAPDDDPDFLRSLDVRRRPGLRGRKDPDGPSADPDPGPAKGSDGAGEDGEQQPKGPASA